MLSTPHKLLAWEVSNPIREYLQINGWRVCISKATCFKPYKGVSSNWVLIHKVFKFTCFKPYKGVSSNSSF